MRTHNIPSCYRKSKRSLLCLVTWGYCQPSMARTTRLKLIFIVPKVFEPLKFDCMYLHVITSKLSCFFFLPNQSWNLDLSYYKDLDLPCKTGLVLFWRRKAELHSIDYIFGVFNRERNPIL